MAETDQERDERARREAEASQRAIDAVTAELSPEEPTGEGSLDELDQDADEMFWERVDEKVKADLGYLPHAA